MAFDKLIDSAKLDTAMNATADAIRAKTGGTTDIPWHETTGFANAITGIPIGSKTQEKTVTPSTSVQSVTPDSGYDGLSKVTVNAMPTATQATPSISVDGAGKITASATQSAGYVAAGTKSATKQLTTQGAKTVVPSTSKQTAVASGVYTTGLIEVAAMPTATQATPAISVSTAGLITASSTQSAGYVAEGTKSATKQLPTQGAKTITPSTADQTAIASGVYTTGAITVKGDANLAAANIAKGVSIFGVAGTFEGGANIDALIDRSITSVESNVTTVGKAAFSGCTKLASIKLPNATTIGDNAFANCTLLTELDLPCATSIGQQAFYYTTNLKTLILRSTTLCELRYSSTFTSTPNTLRVYIPSALVSQYQSSTNWQGIYGLKFRALEEYTVDGTITGALDPAKVEAGYEGNK